MFQSDYILRIIEQFSTVLRRMIASMREARPEEALELSEEALGLALDMDPKLALSLDAESLMFLAGMGSEPDPVRLLLLAEVLAVRVEAFRASGELEAAEREHARVLVVAERALQAAPSERLTEMMSLLGAMYQTPEATAQR